MEHQVTMAKMIRVGCVSASHTHQEIHSVEWQSLAMFCHGCTDVLWRYILITLLIIKKFGHVFDLKIFL